VWLIYKPMDEIKTNAEYYRRGMLLGLNVMAEAMAWIDRTVTAESVPAIALIEASLCGSQGPIAVAYWLAQLPGEFDKKRVARRLLAGMFNRIKRDPDAMEVTYWMLLMATEDDWPGLVGEGNMWTFRDDYDNAANGIYGDPDEIRKEVRGFLLRASLLTEVTLFQQWASTEFPNGGEGEWECEYPAWDRLLPAVLEFVKCHSFPAWSDEELKAVLYALALAHRAFAAVEELAAEMWERADPHQERSRMMVLACLQEIGSPGLETLLAEADKDTRPHLRGYAERIRRGDKV